MEGWVKLHRRITESVVSRNPVLGHVWVQLLVRANFAKRQLNNGQYLEAGQLLIGQTKFADEIGVSRQQLRTALKTLEKCQNLTSESTNAGTLITLTNWEQYQRDDREATNAPTSNQPAANQQLTNDQPAANHRRRRKERKKERREEASAALFGAFWDAVPRKVGRGAAVKAFARAISRVSQARDCSLPEAAEYLTAKMAAWAASDHARDPVRKNLHPSTWLNEDRYEDDEAAWNDTGSEAEAEARRLAEVRETARRERLRQLEEIRRNPRNAV